MMMTAAVADVTTHSSLLGSSKKTQRALVGLGSAVLAAAVALSR